MIPKLIKARYDGDYRVWLEFQDAVQGIVDLESELWGEMFEPLRDKAYFSQIRFDHELGTIVWPNGADFAPEFLHERLRDTERRSAVAR